MASCRKPQSFDADYFAHFYEDPLRTVDALPAARRRAQFVVAYLAHLGVPLRQVLDFGCGLGTWRDCLAELVPEVAHRGVDTSDYLCERFGWHPGSVVNWRGPAADLVICQSVLQYLPARAARSAVANLARHARFALFLEVMTRDDWQRNVDCERSDGECYFRPAAWYRELLGEHFINVGGGLFLTLDSGVVLYELERV